MSRLRLASIICAYVISASIAVAATMEEELTSVTQKVCKQLVAKGHKKVAALDFTDLQGRRNELGRYLAEQLTIEMVGAEGVSVMDRANLQSILSEHKLTEEGLVKPENARKLGEFAGVDAIIIGSVSATDADIVLLIKGISTETAEVVAAGRGKFAKTAEMQQLLTKSIAPGASAASPRAVAGTEDPPAIATKDVGPLRVSVRGIKPLSRYGELTAVLFSLEVTNLDLQQTVYLGQNCAQSESVSHAVTQDGTTWRVTEERGIPEIHSISPSTILDTLQTGRHGESRLPQQGEWSGAFAVIPPGETVRVSITFGGNSVKSIRSLLVEAQWIVGVAAGSNSKPKYSLRNIVFDEIILADTEGPPPTRKNP